MCRVHSSTVMAAVRRLIRSFRGVSTTAGAFFTARQQRTSLQKVVAAGACVTAAGAAAYCYYFYYHHNCRGSSGLRSHVEARLSHLVFPSVSATEKGRTYGLDDGDVYMSSNENRFRQFSSVEYEGQLYMTPLNFIESVTLNDQKRRRVWRSLTKKELDKMLADTPPVWKGSSNLFRNLREGGVISYTEYLFLLCILTKPHAGFRIAFNMFDADGNEMVDKREFLVMEEIFRKKKDRKDISDDVQRLEQEILQLYGHRRYHPHNVREKDSEHVEARGMWDVLRHGTSQVLFSDLTEHMDEKTETTLLVHFFGKRGKAELKFEEFYKFMDNLQTEVLEIEFLSSSKGMSTISEEDFARILLRYTNVDDVSGYLDNVRHTMPDEKGITFDEFRSFFQFLNNLEDFTIAMQMYNFANRSVGQEEFARAVYVATGIKLTHHLVNTVFKIFDEDHDGKLSHKEFIGVMKDRLHRGNGGVRVEEKFTSFKSCLKKELSNK
ncbi:calcium uptake protein 3, mitochondrial-like isoform X1 [Solea senegalensis]|uniref:Calcium uptake protein 3, mitochondrial-like isoform X1 n=1 Tax=Solea senegalensis TaxID=28829 RepID=A0AAV6SM08_SOLSE|nr:calcium uptake protein 3, mitochondrial isoform X1 [Solea senegalensis]KAG7517903.1 calcium uptake protein 3, mitochondrial-like isoform X1 [Solea senegalensis]